MNTWSNDIDLALRALLDLAPIAQRSRLERAILAAFEETDACGYDCNCRHDVARAILAELRGEDANA